MAESITELEARHRLNSCMMEIANCFVNGKIEPLDALNLYVKCINLLLEPFYKESLFTVYPLLYSKFTAYLNLINLKMTCAVHSPLKELQKKSEHPDKIFGKYLVPILEQENVKVEGGKPQKFETDKSTIEALKTEVKELRDFRNKHQDKKDMEVKRTTDYLKEVRKKELEARRRA